MNISWIISIASFCSSSKSTHHEVINILLKSGAEVNAPAAANHGWTALQAAVKGGHGEIVAILLKHSADPNAPRASVGEVTALEAIVGGDDDALVTALLDIATVFPDVPELMAAGAGPTSPPHNTQQIVIKALLTAGADPNERDKSGQTIIHRAYKDINRLTKCTNIKSLKKNTVDYAGSTPLYLAVRANSKSALKILLEWGVEINIRDNSGNTPVMVAVEMGFKTLMDLLLMRGACTDRLKLERVRASMQEDVCLVLAGVLTMPRLITGEPFNNKNFVLSSHFLVSSIIVPRLALFAFDVLARNLSRIHSVV